MSIDAVVHEAIETIYAAATDPDRWPEALQAIADCSGDVGAVLMWQRDDGGFGTIVSKSLDAAQADYVENWWRQDIRAERGVSLWFSDGFDAGTDRHVVSDEEIRSHPIYANFLRPHGLGWFAATPVAPDPRVYVVVSVQRSHEKPPFSDDEVALVGRLGRHVEQSLRLGIRLIGDEVTNRGLKQALTAMNIAMFTIDGTARVTAKNHAAEALIDHGLVLVGGRLMPQYRGDRALFAKRLEDVLDTAALPATDPVLLKGADGNDHLIVHFLPIGDREPLDGGLSSPPRAIVLVMKPGHGDPLDPALVRDLFGLTLNEARVAALVGAGLAPRAAAAKLGITEATTRTVLKRVFAKTGVSRQSELSALLGGIFLR